MEKVEKIEKVIKVINSEHEKHLRNLPAIKYAKGKIMGGKLRFAVNQARGKGWYLVHDGEKALYLFEVTDERAVTSTIYKIIIGATKEEVRKKGEELGLDFTKIDEKEKFL